MHAYQLEGSRTVALAQPGDSVAGLPITVYHSKFLCWTDASLSRAWNHSLPPKFFLLLL